MDLPREMRDMIYVHALVSDHAMCFEGINRQAREDPVLLAIFARCALPISLLTVCKTINAEATPTFYGKNTFALPEIGSKIPSPFTSQARLIRRVDVDLSSAGWYSTWRNDWHWKIQPLLDTWRVMLRNLASFTELDVVEVDARELCLAAFYIDHVEGYNGISHGKNTYDPCPKPLKCLAGQILPELSAGLAPSRGKRKSRNQLKLRVIGGSEWHRNVICEEWKELGGEYSKDVPAENDYSP